MRTILSFCQGFVEKTFDRGDVLLVEGEKEGILYILIEGSLEVLKGDRVGQFSIRINDQWRICFAWPDGTPGPVEVEIADYH